MKNLSIFSLSVLLILLFLPVQNLAQDIPYDEGTVWNLAFIRTAVNSTDDYLKGLKNTWEANMKEAVKEGLIKSYKILLGSAANQEDYNIILLIEYENMASFDPDPVKDKKWDAIEEKIKDKMQDEYEKTVSNYEVIRQWYGRKIMREIYLK
ncbi:MAG: hypothetical protein A2V93_03615 [Ignavibacteria bacterium RBG_16_34_14]|nr:MAG: hypothetical protein A2V93_03615 [Ignavibacteria bacterium RBG_16_34_14]